MDIVLQQIIKKHAEKQGIGEEEAIKIYNDYNREINLKVDDVLKGNISEIRVPHVLRFVFSQKKYDAFTKNDKFKEDSSGESESEG